MTFMRTAIVFSIAAIFVVLLPFAALSQQSGSKPKTPQARKSEDPKSMQMNQYNKAVSLRDSGNNDAAFEIFSRLITESPDNMLFERGYIDTVLEQILDLKQSENNEWKAKAKFAQLRIKQMRGKHFANPHFHYIWSKFSWIADSNNLNSIFTPLNRAIVYRPDFSDAYILKGDIYLEQVKSMSSSRPETMYFGVLNSHTTRSEFLAIAKGAYAKAISIGNLSKARFAYAYFRMGELETLLGGNKVTDAAAANLEQAVSYAPDSRAGILAAKILGR